MRVRRLQPLVPVMVALFFAVCTASAGAADTTIGFEDLAYGTAVGARPVASTSPSPGCRPA